MPEVKDNRLDVEVIKNIQDYIDKNRLSLKRIARASGITYISLWQMLNRNKRISLAQYVALCGAFDEPIGTFIPDHPERLLL